MSGHPIGQPSWERGAICYRITVTNLESRVGGIDKAVIVGEGVRRDARSAKISANEPEIKPSKILNEYFIIKRPVNTWFFDIQGLVMASQAHRRNICTVFGNNGRYIATTLGPSHPSGVSPGYMSLFQSPFLGLFNQFELSLPARYVWIHVGVYSNFSRVLSVPDWLLRRDRPLIPSLQRNSSMNIPSIFQGSRQSSNWDSANYNAWCARHAASNACPG